MLRDDCRSQLRSCSKGCGIPEDTIDAVEALCAGSNADALFLDHKRAREAHLIGIC